MPRAATSAADAAIATSDRVPRLEPHEAASWPIAKTTLRRKAQLKNTDRQKFSTNSPKFAEVSNNEMIGN